MYVQYINWGKRGNHARWQRCAECIRGRGAGPNVVHQVCGLSLVPRKSLVRAESDRNGINADVVPIMKVSDIEETRVVPMYLM